MKLHSIIAQKERNDNELENNTQKNSWKSKKKHNCHKEYGKVGNSLTRFAKQCHFHQRKCLL